MSSIGLLKDARLSVSSVLNRDIKQFGKKYLIDGNEETCWNSDQGTPQYVNIELATPSIPNELLIQFQGGFCGKDCWLEAGNDPANLLKLNNFYPEDVNRLQKFSVYCSKKVSYVKIVFNTSTDFFGRIVIYQLDLIGQKAPNCD